MSLFVLSDTPQFQISKVAGRTPPSEYHVFIRNILTPVYGSPFSAFETNLQIIGTQGGNSYWTVYKLDYDLCKTYGSIYLSVASAEDAFLTGGGVLRVGVSATPPTVTNISPPVSRFVDLGYNSTGTPSIAFFRALASPVGLFIRLYQNNQPSAVIGFYRPEFKPRWWDEDLYPYIVTFSNGSHQIITSQAAVNPYAALTLGTGLLPVYDTNIMVNNIAGGKDVVAGFPLRGPGAGFFVSSESIGIYGCLPSTVGVTSRTGLNFYDEVVTGSRRWRFFHFNSGSQDNTAWIVRTQ